MAILVCIPTNSVRGFPFQGDFKKTATEVPKFHVHHNHMKILLKKHELHGPTSKFSDSLGLGGAHGLQQIEFFFFFPFIFISWRLLLYNIVVVYVIH